MKILVVNILYKPNIGGVENSIFYMCRELKRIGHSPIIVTTDLNQFEPNKRLSKFEIIDEIEVYRVKNISQKNPLRSIINPLYTIFNGWKTINNLNKRCNFNLVISRDYRLFFSAKFAVENAKIFYILPAMVKLQDTRFSSSKTNLIKWIQKIIIYSQHEILQKFAIQNASLNYVFSKNMFNSINSYSSKIKFLTPGVDTEIFKPATAERKKLIRKELNLNNSDFIILFLGRLTKQKGLDIAIDAFSKIKNKKIKLVIVGEGAEKENLQKQAFNLGNNNVIFFTKTNNPAKYYQCSDVFLMSSTYEPFGQTILEAASCNLPVIAFEGESILTSTREILNDMAIYTVPDPSKLASTIESIYVNGLPSQSINNRNFILKKNSWRTFVQKILNDFKN